MGGHTGCNSFGGSIEVDDQFVEIEPGEMTIMGCSGSVGDVETRYLSALKDVSRFSATSDALSLTGGEVELRFEADSET